MHDRPNAGTTSSNWIECRQPRVEVAVLPSWPHAVSHYMPEPPALEARYRGVSFECNTTIPPSPKVMLSDLRNFSTFFFLATLSSCTGEIQHFLGHASSSNLVLQPESQLHHGKRFGDIQRYTLFDRLSSIYCLY